jgi:hypothetical protein
MSWKKEKIKEGMKYGLIITTALAVLFFTSLMAWAGAPPPQERFESFQMEEKPVFLRLNVDTFDPIREESGIPRALKLQHSNGYYIVQFKGPVYGETRSTFEDLVDQVIGYIPDYAFLVKMSDATKAQVEELPDVRWIGLYQPAYKIQPGLLEKEGEVELNILVFNDKHKNLQNVRNELVVLGGSITYDGEDNHIIRARIDASQISRIAYIHEVQWMDEYKPPVPLMNLIRDFTGADTVHIDGFNGSGIVGEVKDSGFDMSHPDFAGQIIGTDGFIIDDDHGTCTFGIVFSSGANNPLAKGMLPGGKGVFADWGVSRSTSINNLVSNWNGTFQSNSWIENILDSTYTSISQEDDLLVATNDVVMVYGAGNSNFGVYSESCSQDSVAKNVICAGALWHSDNTDRSDDQWVDLGFGITPSQGPASDGRVKPDLSGPFDFIYTTDSVDGDGMDGYTAGNYFDDMGGTSGATPVVAGAVGLVYQMYRDNHFDNNPSGLMPHASTVKAILIADAYQYEFSQANRFQQGWGGVDVGSVHAIGENHFIIDEEEPLETSESILYTIKPTGTGPLKISLVWTDVPGTTSSTQHLVNDLNLKVTDPNGFIYWGNYNLDTSKWSSTGGSSDVLNNVENVFIETPTPGTWSIEVIGENVPMDGHSSTIEIDQAFALVAANVMEKLRVDIKSPESGDPIHDVINITGKSVGDITRVDVKIDSDPWKLATGTFNWYYEWDTRTFSDGNHTIYARAFNGTSYSEIESVTVLVDNTPPSTSHLIGEPKFFNASILYVCNATQFTLTASDGTGCGLNATLYNISLEGIEVKDSTAGNSFSLSWGEGNYTIHYRSDDVLGNMEVTKSVDVYLDSSPPTTEMDIGTPKYATNSSDLWNVSSNTIFTLEPSDGESGLNYTWYTIDSVFFTGLDFNLEGYDDGPHTITWGSQDNVENNENLNLITIILDNSPPETELTIEGLKYRATENDFWNVTTNTTFMLTPFDGSSGLRLTYFTIDGVYFEDYNFTLEGYQDGLHIISWGSEDNLGNMEGDNTVSVHLDTTAPLTNMTISKPKYRSSPTDIWCVTKASLFSLMPTDDHAQVRAVWYTINGTYFESSWFTLKNHSDGIFSITWGSVDNLGHNETGNTIIVNLDSQPPDVDMMIGEPKYRKGPNDCLNVTSTTLFSLIAYDSNVGINTTWYTINTAYHEGTYFNLSGYEEGYCFISWGSVDHLGNKEPNRTVSVYLNTIPPSTKLEIEGIKYRASGNDCWNVSIMTEFILSPSETRSGINATWFVVDGEYLAGNYFKFADYSEGLHLIWGRTRQQTP